MVNTVRQANEHLIEPGKQGHFVVLSREEPLSSMCSKILQAQNITTNNCIHLLIASKRQSDLLNVDNRTRNKVLALSATLMRLSSEINAFSGGNWKKTAISPDSVLITIEVDSKRSLTHDDVLGILQRTFPQNPLPHSTIKVPNLEELVVELKALRGETYVNRVQSDLPSILDILCASAKRQREEIAGLISVLNFSKSIGLIHQHLSERLEKYSNELQELSSSRDTGYINRQIDGAVYALFELTEKSAIRSLASAVSPALYQLIRRGLQAPLLSRAVRQSFLKGIDFFAAEPALIDVIKHTDTDDACGFIIIQNFLSPKSWIDNLSEGPELINELSKMSSKGLILLARDVRRTVPSVSNVPSVSLVDCITWISQQNESRNVRRTSLSKCLLLHYFNCLRPGVILWLNKNFQKVGLVKEDVVEVSALAGYDVPYTIVINKKFISSNIHFGIVPPSKSSSIVEYFKLNLKNWVGRIRLRDGPTIHIEQPLVSVIFTTYEPDIDLFKISLESILIQTYENIEIIVIDDCSSLGTSRQLESLIETIAQHHAYPIIYQRNSSNLGQYVSRNTAIAIAQGEFIAIQDDDDISHPERLYTQIAPMLKDSAIMATHANHIRISNNARIMSDGGEAGEIQGDAPISFIWRRRVFKQIGTFLPTRTRGDIEFRTRIRQHYGNPAILELKLPLVLMRGGMGTVSSEQEYYYRSALNAFRYMMMHVPAGVDNLKDPQRWIPTLLQSQADQPVSSLNESGLRSA